MRQPSIRKREKKSKYPEEKTSFAAPMVSLQIENLFRGNLQLSNK